jgi:pimeloyl-ACP methyl ester carboxylesterase
MKPPRKKRDAPQRPRRAELAPPPETVPDEVSSRRWQKLMLSSGMAVGAAAAFNAWTRRDVRPLDNLIGGREEWFGWRGHRVAYTKRGSGDALLLVHGIHTSAWSYEWRHNVDTLAREHTVYTIDLLGFGRSDRPSARYSGALYTALIADFASQVIGGPSVLLGSGLSGAYVIALASRDARRFPGVVAVGPTGVSRLAINARVSGDVPRIAIGTPVVGTALFNSFVSRRSLEFALERMYANDRFVTPELVDVHFATAHQPGAKHAPSAFVAQQLNLGVREELRRLTQPLLITWGEQAVEAPMDDLRAFRAIKPDADVAIFSPSGDLPHDERADEWNEAVLGFLARLSSPRAGPDTDTDTSTGG